MKHKHKPNSLGYQFGWSAYRNPQLQRKILCYFSFECHASVTWSPVETHSHCLVGKGSTRPQWDEKVITKMKIYGSILRLSQVRTQFCSKGESWVIIITNIRKWFFCKKGLVNASMFKNKEGQNWGFHEMLWSDWCEGTYRVHWNHTVHETIISISQPSQTSFTHA